MTAPTLSPEAQQELDELERPVFLSGGDFFQNYRAMLDRLASEEVADPDDVKINDISHDAWKAKRQEIRIARELQQHAAAQLQAMAATTAAVAKLPQLASLDDFLERLMPNEGRGVRRDRFNLFLTHEAELEVDDQMKLFPKDITREDRIARMALVRLENLDHADIPALTQYDIQEPFRIWSKSQDGGNLAGEIVAVKGKKADMMNRMLELLFAKGKESGGLTRKQWQHKAMDLLGISESTFYRYYREMKGRYDKRGSRFYRKSEGSEK